MSTHSTITVKRSDGKWHSIYCQFDGYLSHNGRILYENYNSQELAEKLVSNGNLSSLDKFCDKPESHTYKTPVKGYSLYYGRDRGDDHDETGNIGDTYDSAVQQSEEYNYIWDGVKWFVKFNGHSTDGFVELSPSLWAQPNFN